MADENSKKKTSCTEQLMGRVSAEMEHVTHENLYNLPPGSHVRIESKTVYIKPNMPWCTTVQ